MKLPHRHLTPYRGRPVYTFNVTIRQSGIGWECTDSISVVAHTAADAVNLIRDTLAPRVEHPTEIETAGPKGGIVHRFIGWESLIGAQLFQSRRDRQLDLNFKHS